MSCFDKPRFPKLMVGDIPLYCNHDTDPEEAIEKWQSRKKKVNYSHLLQDALKQYARRENKNLHQLMEHANLFHVDRILRQYMEVLL